jgi:hypothetical protein
MDVLQRDGKIYRLWIDPRLLIPKFSPPGPFLRTEDAPLPTPDTHAGLPPKLYPIAKPRPYPAISAGPSQAEIERRMDVWYRSNFGLILFGQQQFVAIDPAGNEEGKRGHSTFWRGVCPLFR